MGAVQSKLQEVNEFVKFMLPDPSMVSIVIEGASHLVIGLNLSVFLRMGNLLEKHSEIIKKVQHELEVDQNVEISVRLAASPEDILAPGAEPFITQLLFGISLSVRFNVWKRLSDVLIKMLENGDIDTSLAPILGGLAPTFLMRLAAKIDLTVDERMMSKIQENPIIQPLLMDADSLIGATSGVSSDEDFETHLANLDMPPAVGHLIGVLCEHMGDELNLSVTHPHLGLQARLSAKSGLKLVVKTIAKYLSAKEQ